jgi:enamine deaminase RidA (YjgF/YER057c/UK114 family)
MAAVSGGDPARAADAPAIEYLNSGKILPGTLPFSEAVRVGNLVYLSGQLGIVPGSMKLVPGGIKEEARQTLENIRTALEAHGYKMSDLVKCTVMLADMSEWAAFNDVYKTSSPATFRHAARSAPMAWRSARASKSNASRPSRSDHGRANGMTPLPASNSQ